MTGNHDLKQDSRWNNETIEKHLKSAVDVLTPNVLDRIDLNTPQISCREESKVMRLYRKMRTVSAAAAACLCILLLGGGVAAFENRRIESVIGIDVNPSIELSVNRRDRILKAEPLNQDAAEILDDMDLKNVDLNIGVNAVIGSMVRHGYFEEAENAILVTVSNEDRQKASKLRENVVGDIESSLEEHKVNAVVYDQQAAVTKEVKKLAEKYDISYGKAYFLQELVMENNLSGEDMEVFAAMTMEEIAREISERSYSIKKDEEPAQEESSKTGQTEQESISTEPEHTEESSRSTEESPTEITASESSSESGKETAAETTGISESETPEEETEEAGSGKKAKIDFVDFESGILNVTFKEKVKWKNPTVSVTDEDGTSYSARITDTGAESCEIQIKGLPGGMECTFILAGVAPKPGGSFGSIKGYFDTPDIAEELESSEEPEEDEDIENENTEDETTEEMEIVEPDVLF